jgi:uncharacterized protein YhaN
VRIDSIDLIRFGHFSNREIEFPLQNPDYHLVYGDNEAGKSTLLRGISGLFFGMPTRTPDAHSCKTAELRIGAAISSGGKSFFFRRRKGTSGTLLNLDEVQIQEAVLGMFLQELDRDRFEQLFGLNHHRLREGGEELLRGKGDVGSALFQAAGLLDLRNLLEGIDDEAKEVFSPKSRGKVIGNAIEEYKDARAEVRRLAITAAAVKEKQVGLDRTKLNHETLKAEAQSLQRDLVKLSRIARNKPDLSRLYELRAALLDLGAVPRLPAGSRRQRDDAMSALASATSQIEALAAQIAQRRERILALPLSTVFRTHAKEIEELNAGISDYIRGTADRPKRAAERADAIQLAEVEWKEIWRKRPLSDAGELKSAYARKTEVLALVTEHARLTAALEQAEEQVRSGTQEQERINDELALHPEPPDPTVLIVAIERAKSLGDTENSLARLNSDVKRLMTDTNRELGALGLWSGSIEKLESLRTPLPSTIDQYTRHWESGNNTRRELKQRLSHAQETIHKTQAELERLTVKIGKVGEGTLAEVRTRRNELWQLIRASAFDKTLTAEEAQTNSRSSVPLPEFFGEHLRRSDEIADLRFTHAKDVAIQDRLTKEFELAVTEQQSIEQEIAELETAENEMRERWVSEWRALGSDPLSPAEMKEWMQSRKAILERLEQGREKENDLGVLQERTLAAAAQIELCSKEPGLALSVDSQANSLPVLIKVAQVLADRVEEERRTIADLRRRGQLLSVERQHAKLLQCREKLLEWSGKWSHFVKALLLPEGSTPVQVGEALAVLENVFGHLKEAEHLQHRVKRMGDNIDEFEAKASRLIAAIAPSLAALAPQAAAVELHAQYVQAGKAETERATLETQNATDERAIVSYRGRVDAATATLDNLRQLARCEDDQQLEIVITQAESGSDKQDEYDRIAKGLIERNDVSDLKQIEEEASGYELDVLKSEIFASEERQKLVQDEVFKTGSEYGKLLQEFERLEGSEESALQAQRAEDALAKIRPAVAQYLRLRIASEVLHRAIEAFREKHQGPVLSKASELFSRLTLGDHSGLTTGFGDDDRPVLVAIRKDGEQVAVEGLSDGTRDQLYLALRLAAIEYHVGTVAACPVILDDILIHSDDARAFAALEVIGDLAKRTQVLFFTHHRRLAELGIKAGAQLIELDIARQRSRGPT